MDKYAAIRNKQKNSITKKKNTADVGFCGKPLNELIAAG